jgi:hypothetical protein
MQGVSKIALQWYSKCCCVASVTKTFTLEGVQTIRRSTPTMAAERNSCEVIEGTYRKNCTEELQKGTRAFI